MSFSTMRSVVAALGLALVAIAAWAAEMPAPASCPPKSDECFSRERLTGLIAEARKVVSPNGVEELLELPIGGTKQWISVRGRDRANPVLLMIHGGPASPEMPTSWYFQKDWEDFFTVVQWDQRGSGKSYDANDPEVIGPTLSLDRIVEDAGEVVQYLRQRYGKEKVFVLGHSWGSLVGLSLARRHPEWLHAYVGMGQMVSGRENERVGYEMTLKLAEEAGNAQAVKELKELAPYPEADGTLPIEKVNNERKWSVALGGLTYGRSDLDYYFDLVKLSPEYTVSNMAAIDKGSRLSLGRLFPELMRFDFTGITRWRCPIVMIAGRHDLTTPGSPVEAWMKRVQAPSKKMIWLENSAHMMMVEEPGRLLMHLVQDVRPLAR